MIIWDLTLDMQLVQYQNLFYEHRISLCRSYQLKQKEA